MNNRQLRKHLFSKWPYKEDKDFKNQLRGRKPKWLIDGHSILQFKSSK